MEIPFSSIFGVGRPLDIGLGVIFILIWVHEFADIRLQSVLGFNYFLAYVLGI